MFKLHVSYKQGLLQFNWFTCLFYLGHYIYVDPSQGTFTSQAEIDGPLLQPCSSTCQISFWYHMYGSG